MTDEPGLKKRSVTIAGHRTSVSLEEEFWQALRETADERGVALARLVAEIDGARGPRSLSSAIRVFLLHEARRRAASPH